MIQGEATFISLLKWGLIVFVLVTAAITAYLAFLNRDSEKVMLTFLPALALGTIGALITILFGLKEEIREVEFPALFTYEKESKALFGLRPDLKYLPPSEIMASIHLQEISKAHPKDLKNGPDDLGMALYGDIALRLVFDSLIQIFPMNWDVKTTQINLPFVNQKTFGPNQNVAKSEVLSWEQISATFPQSHAMQAPAYPLGKLAIPPGTKIWGSEERDQTGGLYKSIVHIENDFVDMEISITFSSGVADIGMYSLMIDLSPEQAQKYWTASYLIAMKAKFNAYRSGHPAMPKYKSWVNNAFESIRDQLDSQRHWERAKELLITKKILH